MIDPVSSSVSVWLLATTPTVQAAGANALGPLSQVEPAPMLDPPTRAVLLMALLAFVILGMGLIAGAMIAGRWVRRLGGDQLPKPMRLRRSNRVGPDSRLPGDAFDTRRWTQLEPPGRHGAARRRGSGDAGRLSV